MIGQIKRICVLLCSACLLLSCLSAFSLDAHATLQNSATVIENASELSSAASVQVAHPENPYWIVSQVNGEDCLFMAVEAKKLHIFNLDTMCFLGVVSTPFNACSGMIADNAGIIWMVGDSPYIFRYDPAVNLGENAYYYGNTTGIENTTSIIGVTGGLGCTIGVDGSLYFGCYPVGVLAKYTPHTGQFVNMGKVGTDDANCYANAPVYYNDYVYITTAGDTNNDGVKTFELAKFYAESGQLIKRVDITQYFSQENLMVRGMSICDGILLMGGEVKEGDKAAAVDAESLTFVDIGIESPIFFSPTVERDGKVWFSGKDAIYQCARRAGVAHPVAGMMYSKIGMSLQCNAVSFLTADNNRWFSGESILTYNYATGQFVIYNPNAGDRVPVNGFVLTERGVDIGGMYLPQDVEAAYVQKMINNLPSMGQIELEHEELIQEVREAYNGLSYDQRMEIEVTPLLNAEHVIYRIRENLREQDIKRLKELIELIADINDVTLEHEAIIEEAYEIYSCRRDFILENHREIDWSTLLSASFALSDLQRSAAATVDERIKLIGSFIRLSEEYHIREARSMYEALTPGSKEHVTRLEELEKAEEELEKLLALMEQAEKVDALIAQIEDPIDIFSGSAIREAREAYDALPEDAQDYVIELGRLQEAEELYANALTWTIILTATAVVVLAGGAVVTILVLKKRKKNAD